VKLIPLLQVLPPELWACTYQEYEPAVRVTAGVTVQIPPEQTDVP